MRNSFPWYVLVLLILAGEAIFILPFVLARVFRPTVLDTFVLDNIQLGYCYSIYGIVALFSYVFGGPLADRFSPRKLIAIALWMTAAGGLVYSSFPSYSILLALYGYWGFTTIFLFWAPMIKATRLWGGVEAQGRAFGFLDGGRGLVGALFGAIGVAVFASFTTKSIGSIDLDYSRQAFRQVILVSTFLVALIGVLVWFFLHINSKNSEEIILEKINWDQIRIVLKLPSIWLLMGIILCAYVGYKVTDIFSLYAQDVMGFDQVDSARVGTFLLFVRPLIGVAIGLAADRSKPSKWLFYGFILSFIGALLFTTNGIISSSILLFILSVMIVAIGVYATRALYFAVMEKGQIPLALTGTAVGLISLVGYTPDIFAGPVIGYLLENTPGIVGHQHVFWMLAGFSLIGVALSWIYYRKYS